MIIKLIALTFIYTNHILNTSLISEKYENRSTRTNTISKVPQLNFLRNLVDRIGLLSYHQ